MNTTTTYRVRRTLSYARTVYGDFGTRAEAEKCAEGRTLMGYPSEVIEIVEAAR